MRNKIILFSIAAVLLISCTNLSGKPGKIIISSNKSNNLYMILTNSGMPIKRYDTPSEALRHADKDYLLLILANEYPQRRSDVDAGFYDTLREKKIRALIEYPAHVPGFGNDTIRRADKERVVVNTRFFGNSLDSLIILGLNGLHYISDSGKIASPLIVSARVAGFDNAIYGLPEKTDPLLFSLPGADILVATTSLSNFVSGRYAPQQSWGIVWDNILAYLMPGKEIATLQWELEVKTTYGKDEPLPQGYQQENIRRGIEWYINARMLIASSMADSLQQLIDNGRERIPWDNSLPLGDGSHGSLECVLSEIDENGSQPLGIIVRGDCVSETAMAYALAGKVLGNEESKQIAENLLDYYLFQSDATKKEYGDPSHPAYGLIP